MNQRSGTTPVDIVESTVRGYKSVIVLHPSPAQTRKSNVRRYSFVLWDYTQVFAATVIAAGVKNQVYQSAGSWVKPPLASPLSPVIWFYHVAALTYRAVAHNESKAHLTWINGSINPKHSVFFIEAFMSVNKSESRRIRTVTWEDPKISARDAMSISGFDYLCSIKDGKIKPPPVAVLLGYRLSQLASLVQRLR